MENNDSFTIINNSNIYMGDGSTEDTPIDQMYFEKGENCCESGTCEQFESPQTNKGDYAGKAEIERLELELKNKANLTDKGKHVANEMIDGILIDKDIPVIGENIGSFQDGDIVKDGTTFEEFVKLLLQKKISPTYILPSLQITCSELSYEIGSTISPIIHLNYSSNDGGSATNFKLIKNNIDIDLNTDTKLTETYVLSENVSYQGKVNYDAGLIKSDNLNQPYPIGAITAGNCKSSIITIQPYRNAFYGSAADINTPLDNSTLRKSQSLKNPTKGSSFIINIPSYTRLIYFAIPSNITDNITSVIYKEAGNVDVKISFKKSTILIYGANNKYPIDYDLYFYIADSYFSSSATYIINI